MKRRIRAISFDFDNCLFHTKYFWNKHRPDPYEIILKNVPLLERLRSQNHAYDENICFVGSNRQSKTIDSKLSNHKKYPTESCFSAIKKVCEFLDMSLDPFLLADIYGNVPDGQSFHQALSSKVDSLSHPNWTFDKSKLSILYAQMHKLAAAYPDDSIVYHFFDDKRSEDFTIKMESLLEDLESYFTRFPEMIPKNVILRLNHYAGQAVTPYEPIQGTGIIDTNYRKTIKEMAKVTIKTAPRSAMYSFIDYVLPQHLKSRESLLKAQIKTCSRHGYFSMFNPFKPSLEADIKVIGYT